MIAELIVSIRYFYEKKKKSAKAIGFRTKVVPRKMRP